MKHFFLIDDDEDDRFMFCEAMEEVAPHFICHTAANGGVALEMLINKEIELPHIIFLDINMPQVSGWECLAALKNNAVLKNIPVIMYSTSSHTEDMEKAIKGGAVCFFIKPFAFTELKNCLGLVVKHLSDNTLFKLTEASSSFMGKQLF